MDRAMRPLHDLPASATPIIPGFVVQFKSMEPAQPTTTEHEPSQAHKIEKEEVLYTWTAPLRPFKRRDKEFFTTVIAIAILIGLILFFLEGILPVAVVAALVFLVYVLSTIPPEDVDHKITNKGVSFAGTRYPWEELRRFWFAARFGTDLLVVEANRAPWRIEMVISLQDKEPLRKVLEDHLPFEEASPSFLDKSAVWLSRRVPLE